MMEYNRVWNCLLSVTFWVLHFHASHAISFCPSLLTVPGCLSQFPSLGDSAWRQPYNCMQGLVQCRSQLLSILCQGSCPPECGKCPKNKALVRQTPCIPGPELVLQKGWFHGAQPGWGDGAQHRKLFGKYKKCWKQMGAEMSGYFNFILSLVISVGHSLQRWMGAWRVLRKSVISNPEHYQLFQCNLWLVCLPCEVVSARSEVVWLVSYGWISLVRGRNASCLSKGNINNSTLQIKVFI